MNYSEVITDYSVLADRVIFRDGFTFTSISSPGNVYDAIVIRSPYNAQCSSPRLKASQKSLQEHIEYVNKHSIEKAMIIANDISFIFQCPSLKYLSIRLSDDAPERFDYSPLYKLKEIRFLSCVTEYGSLDEKQTTIDLSRISGLQSVSVPHPNRYLGFQTIETLQKLGVSNYADTDISKLFTSKNLDALTMIQCRNRSLNGIENSSKMRCLEISYNRSLTDISALAACKHTLKALSITKCPKVEDFSVLSSLENLEYLMLIGSNTIPSLAFMKNLKNLKTFIFDINVQDGNLLPCKDLSYVYCGRNRKHYNLTNSDLPKDKGTVCVNPFEK